VTFHRNEDARRTWISRQRAGARHLSRLGALLVGLVASRVARADCTKDSECKGDRICEKGRCVDAPVARPAGCRVDIDCRGEDICVERQCESPTPGAHAPAAAPPPRAAVVPAPPAAPVTVPVRMISGAEPLHVTASPFGGLPQSCTAPCTLQLPIGSIPITVSRDQRSFGSTVAITGPTVVHGELRGSLAPAIAFTAIGGAGFLIGLAVFASTGFQTKVDCGTGTGETCLSGVGVAGAATMGISSAFLLIGVLGFAFVGHNRIDTQPGSALVTNRLRIGAMPAPGGAKSALAFDF